jgi:hypothetical protein
MTGEIGLLGISYREIANAKFGNMSKSETARLAFENILDEFPIKQPPDNKKMRNRHTGRIDDNRHRRETERRRRRIDRDRKVL